MANNTQDIINLIKYQAGINDRIAIRDSIRIFNDDWMDLIAEKIAQGFGAKSRKRLSSLITTEINVLKTVAMETALVYKNPPTRTVSVGESEDTDERYSEIVKESCLDLVMKTANRYDSFVNHMLIKAVYRDGRMELDLITPDAFDIFTDANDWKKIVAIRYYVGQQFVTNGNSNTQHQYQKAYLWTKYPCSVDGIMYDVGVYTFNSWQNAGDTSFEPNPYKDTDGSALLPFVLTYEEYPVECLLNFTRNSDLVESSLQVAVMNTLMGEMFKFGSFKQLVATGPTNTVISDQMQSGYATLWKLFSSDGTANISTLDMQANISQFMEYVVKRIQLILAQRGIPPSSFTLTGTPESGYRAKMDRQKLLDKRQDAIGFYRQFERDLFKIMRTVNNVHHSKKVNEAAEFEIDFDDLAVEMTTDEENRNWTFEFSNNISTPIDAIRKKNPDLDQDDAKVQYELNKTTNAQKTPAPTLNLPTTNQATNPVK